MQTPHGEVYVVVGPTASGKTAYAVRLAMETGGEIVSADSMQIYRGMDIGTAKATLEERRGVLHHMIDVAEPDEPFSVADYRKMASERIREIISRGRRAVVAGGTGQYISALIYNIDYPPAPADPQYRAALARDADLLGLKALHAELGRIDPLAARKIHENDQKRIIRALEIYRATGKPISEHERASRLTQPEHSFKIIGLDVPRDELYARIDARVDKMFRDGLEEEAYALYCRFGGAEASGYGAERPCGCEVLTAPAFQAIGYKELFVRFRGEITFTDAVSLIKTRTRRYAKRQLTWFRAMKEIDWTDAAPNR